MTPNDWLLDETRRWVERAERDLRAADLCAAELPAEALFHCQQATEKYLKAWLTWNQQSFRKTHDIRELLGLCVKTDPALAHSLASAEDLSHYAWRFRYPGAPYEPDASEEASGRAVAELVRTEVRCRLPEAALS